MVWWELSGSQISITKKLVSIADRLKVNLNKVSYINRKLRWLRLTNTCLQCLSLGWNSMSTQSWSSGEHNTGWTYWGSFTPSMLVFLFCVQLSEFWNLFLCLVVWWSVCEGWKKPKGCYQSLYKDQWLNKEIWLHCGRNRNFKMPRILLFSLIIPWPKSSL